MNMFVAVDEEGALEKCRKAAANAAGSLARPSVYLADRKVNNTRSGAHDQASPEDKSTDNPGNASQVQGRQTPVQVISVGLAEESDPFTPEFSNVFVSATTDSRHINITTMAPRALHFPVIGRARHPSPQSQSELQCAGPASPSLSRTLNSSTSETSSSGWTEDGRERDVNLFVSLSCYTLLWTFLKLVTAPSESGQQPRDGPNHTKDVLGHKSSSRNSRVSGKKRRDTSEDELDDEDGERDAKRKRIDATCPDEHDIRPLACPFNKFDNVLFGPESADEAYHCCATSSFMNVARLKRDFSSQAMVAAHLRETPMCPVLEPPLFVEKISKDLAEELGLDRKNSPRTDRIAYWHKIYDTFFPGAAKERPVSPYYEGPAAEHLRQFLLFSERALGQLIPAVQERTGLLTPLTPDGQERLLQEIQQEAGQRYLQHIAHRSMPRLCRPVPISEVLRIRSSAQSPDPSMNVVEAPSLLASTSLETIERNIQQASPSDIAAGVAAALHILPQNLQGSHVDVGYALPTSQVQESRLDSQSIDALFEPLFAGDWHPAAVGGPQDFGHDFSQIHFSYPGQFGDVVYFPEGQVEE
ncbi:hypothetical protein AYO20_08169 [Fonsecaea nubica]|uniref:Uncharacterized protein n=1 Tax=Fonsecaea nubica TaxID=856822 RepID=A0A178CQA2_9EURO|nr:hypothetical protein AYO20_08169 [Fonsecaea nubica]OAL31626.1 hypothetical protein AYO20_08169 [Fonsecaea nubica]